MATYQTEQKKELLDFLQKNQQRAFTVDELWEALSKDESYVCPPGKSTLYRLIPKMMEEGGLRQFRRENDRKTVYQATAGIQCNSHLHLKCVRCGRMIHMSRRESEELARSIYGWENFRMDTSKTTIFGLCRDCI